MGVDEETGEGETTAGTLLAGEGIIPAVEEVHNPEIGQRATPMVKCASGVINQVIMQMLVRKEINDRWGVFHSAPLVHFC